MEILNLSTICRTCKCITPQMHSIFESYENPFHSSRIDEMLMTCTSVQVSCGDGLPAQICQVCTEQLNNAFIFKRQCEEIDASLREYAKNIKFIEIKQELEHSDFTESFNASNNLSNDQLPCESLKEPSVVIVTPKIERGISKTLSTSNGCTQTSATPESLRCHKHTPTNKIYKCKQCDNSYMSFNQLRRHKQLHNQKIMYACRICSKILTTKNNLKRHLATHSKEKPFSCSTCSKGFSGVDQLQRHQPICKGDSGYLCDICNKVFSAEDSLAMHKKKHANKQFELPTIENLANMEDLYYPIYPDVDPLNVDDCSQPQVPEGLGENQTEEAEETTSISEDSNSIDALLGDLAYNDNINNGLKKSVKNLENMEDSNEVKVEEHLMLADVGLNDVGEDSVDSAAPSRSRLSIRAIKTEQNEEEYSCTICEEKFNTISSRDKHIRIKHEGSKMYKCKVCSKEFSRDIYLKQHCLSHSIKKPFRCSICSRSFRNRDNFNQHQRQHKKGNNFKCEFCKKIFRRADLLEKHKASKHSTEEKIITEKYVCVLCNASFATETCRDVHVQGHNEQKYHCKVCKETFLSKSHLTEHTELHSKRPKKFLCSECGKKFIRNDYLVVHMRRHTGEKPYKCKYCEKDFPRRTDLTVHERCHTGEKPHLCTICGKSFARAWSLKLHMRTHTGEKPHRCMYCDAAFTQSNDLKIHNRRRHTEEQVNQVKLKKELNS